MLFKASSLVSGDLEIVSRPASGTLVKYVSTAISSENVGLVCSLKETQQPRNWRISERSKSQLLLCAHQHGEAITVIVLLLSVSKTIRKE